MSNLVGASAIAAALSDIMGRTVSRWHVYRLAKRKTSPISRDPEGSRLTSTKDELRSWVDTSRFAPVFAKQIDRRRLRSQSQGTPTLQIFGAVGEDNLTDQVVFEAIDALGDPKSIRVLMNSNGGFVKDGLAIYHALRSHSARIEVEIVGVAASMASCIAMAGDKVSMAEDALFMLHDPWGAMTGNADDLRAAADILDKHGESIAGIYARKSGLTEDVIKEMMNQDGGEGTYLNAREALQAGFIDEVLEPASADLPDLPAAALAKRIVTGRRRHRIGGDGTMWKKLSAALRAAIRAMVDDQTTEDEVIKEVAEATDSDADDITQLLDGKGDEPTLESLQALAEVLDIELDTLVAAAREDGIDVQKPEPSATGRRRQPISAAANANVRAAVKDALRELAKMRSQITARGQRLGIPDAIVATISDQSVDVADANARMIDWLADPKNQPQISGVNGSVTVGDDDRDKWLDGMSQWLVIKAGQRRMVEAHAKQVEGNVVRLDPGNFRGFRLIDIARDVLEREGISCRGMSPYEIAKAALAPRAESGLGTRSDFPILLENVLHKMLLAAYETAPDQWRAIAATGSVQDFRAHPRLKLGQLGRLDALLESGEFKQLHFPDAERETIQAGTFGNIIGLTRQAIVNDDVDGFSRLTVMLGRAAGRSIEIDVFALFGANGLGPTMNDGNPLFHADHNNIAAPAGVPSVDAFEAGRVVMAQQRDPSGEDFLNLRPDVWVGPIGLGAAARTTISAEYDFSAENAGGSPQFMKPNTVRDLVRTVVDTPRLTGPRWYLLADPAIAPVIEVVFLEGEEAPVIEAMEGFDFDGARWRVRHDWGVGATDFRGAITNAGAS